MRVEIENYRALLAGDSRKGSQMNERQMLLTFLYMNYPYLLICITDTHCCFVLFFFFLFWVGGLVISDDDSYPKGLVVAFKLERMSIEGPVEQNGVHHEKENAVVSETGAMPNSTENVIESEKMSLENVKGSEESPDGVEIQDEDKIAKSPGPAEQGEEKMMEDAIQVSTEMATDAIQVTTEDVTDNAAEQKEDANQGSGEMVTDDAIQKNEDTMQGSGVKVTDDVTQKNEDAIQGSGEKVTDDATQKNEDAIEGSGEKVIDDTTQKNEGATQGSAGKVTDDATQKNVKPMVAEEVSWEDLKQVFQRFGTVKVL